MQKKQVDVSRCLSTEWYMCWLPSCCPAHVTYQYLCYPKTDEEKEDREERQKTEQPVVPEQPRYKGRGKKSNLTFCRCQLLNVTDSAVIHKLSVIVK